MMIISAKIVKKPEKMRNCDCHLCDGGKIIIGEAIKLFGYADTGDKPYIKYICPASGKESQQVQKVLARSKLKSVSGSEK